MKQKRRYLFCLLALGICLQGYAQTCCSGGVPVSSNLGLPPSDGKTLQVSLNYDLNVLETLKTGTRTLEDDSRSRKTHSALLQLGYSFTDRFSVDVFASWVRQERTIFQFGNENFTYTSGLGDAVLLFKYKLLALNNNETLLSAGVGTKLPTGRSDLRDRNGIALNADLQPGSGAFDGILWGQFTQVMSFRPSLSFIATTIYSYKGKNDDYLGSQIYQFGSELQVRAGFSDRVIIGKSLVDPSLTFRYRLAGEDQNNGNDVPSTGGNWLFINPGVAYWITPDLSANANIELPLIADITGTQVTPTYRINAGFFYRLNLGGPTKELIDPLNPVTF